MKKPDIFKYIKPEEIPIILIVLFLATLFVVGAVIGIIDFVW